jgi:transitional endoplasmic reticulum ATPase
VVEIPLPDRETQREIMEIHSRGKPLAADVDLDELLDNAGEIVGADIELLCRNAAMLAIREFVETGKVTGDEPPAKLEIQISRGHFLQALKEMQESGR